MGNELITCLADGNWSTSIVCLLKSQFSLFFIILPYICIDNFHMKVGNLRNKNNYSLEASFR